MIKCQNNDKNSENRQKMPKFIKLANIKAKLCDLIKRMTNNVKYSTKMIKKDQTMTNIQKMTKIVRKQEK